MNSLLNALIFNCISSLNQKSHRLMHLMKMKVEIGQSGTHQYFNSFPFLQNYKDTLQVQVLESAGKIFRSTKFGTDLSEEKLSHFQEEQIGQLYELMLESTKTNRQFDIQGDSK